MLTIPPGTTIAKRLRLARQAVGLDIAEVARSIGVSTSTWEKTEAGARPPRRGELIAFAQITGQELSLFDTSDSGAPTLPLLPAAVKPKRRRKSA